MVSVDPAAIERKLAIRELNAQLEGRTVNRHHFQGLIVAGEATLFAAQQGLKLPLVYNTGGYDSIEALALPDG